MQVTYFTLIFGHFVLESLFTQGVEFNVVPSEDFDSLLVRTLVGIVMGHRVTAVVCHVLATVSRQQLQEGHLVAV